MKVNLLTENEILYFMHIPKTAGTTVNDLMRRNIPIERTTVRNELYYFHLFNKVDKEEVEKFNYIAGHFNFSSVNDINKKLISFTVLRDPIERTISQFSELRKTFGKREPSNLVNSTQEYIYQKIIVENIEFDTFVKDSFFQKQFIVNFQTMFIGSDQKQIFLVNEPIERQMDRINLDKAISNLSKFEFIGFQDKMEETMLKVAYMCGFYPEKKVRRLNANTLTEKIRKSLSDETMNMLKDMLKLDYELIEIARGIFSEQLSEIKREDVIENFNKALYIRTKLNPKHVNFSEGWSIIETDSSNAHSIWSGPDNKSMFHLYIEDIRDVEIKISIKSVLLKENLKRIKVSVNGNQLRTQLIKENGKRILTAKVKKEFLNSETKVNEWIIEVPKTVSPKELGISNDTRKLGIMISEIEYE